MYSSIQRAVARSGQTSRAGSARTRGACRPDSIHRLGSWIQPRKCASIPRNPSRRRPPTALPGKGKKEKYQTNPFFLPTRTKCNHLPRSKRSHRLLAPFAPLKPQSGGPMPLPFEGFLGVLASLRETFFFPQVHRRHKLTVPRSWPFPKTSLASPLYRPGARNPLRHRGQRREVGVRRGLIPIPRRVEVVPAIVGVTVLHGVLHVAFEGHRIVAVPPVAAIPAAGPLRIHNQRRAVLPVGERDRVELAAEVRVTPIRCPRPPGLRPKKSQANARTGARRFRSRTVPHLLNGRSRILRFR